MDDLAKTVGEHHDRIADDLDTIERLGQSASADERREVVEDLVAKLREHDAAERDVVLPLMVQFLDDGPAIAADHTQELAELEGAVAELTRTSSDDPGHEAALRNVVERARTHLGKWNDERWPALREALDDDERVEAGEAFEQAVRATDDPRLDDA